MKKFTVTNSFSRPVLVGNTILNSGDSLVLAENKITDGLRISESKGIIGIAEIVEDESPKNNTEETDNK